MDYAEFLETSDNDRLPVLPGLITKYRAVKGRRYKAGIQYLESYLDAIQTERDHDFSWDNEDLRKIMMLADEKRPTLSSLELQTLRGVLADILLCTMQLQANAKCIHQRASDDMAELIGNDELFVRVQCGGLHRDVPVARVGVDPEAHAVIVEADPSYQFAETRLN
jgi:hypothetical protein